MGVYIVGVPGSLSWVDEGCFLEPLGGMDGAVDD